MARNPIDIYFDFVDPLSVLLMFEVDQARMGGLLPSSVSFRWLPLETSPPPTPLVGLDDPSVAERWETARQPATDLGIELRPPNLVPWTRKAHELMAHAEATAPEAAHDLRLAIARAYALEGRDIGRVDILMELATARGLDRTETKAVLDVDRFDAKVAEQRNRALAAGIRLTPTVVIGERRVEGFHNRTALGTLLGT